MYKCSVKCHVMTVCFPVYSAKTTCKHHCFNYDAECQSGRPEVLPMNFLPFFFLSIHRAQQPRGGWPSNVSGGLVVGKTSTIGIEILPTPPLIFTILGGGKKCKIWCRFLHYSTLSRSRLKMQQDIRTLKHFKLFV